MVASPFRCGGWKGVAVVLEVGEEELDEDGGGGVDGDPGDVVLAGEGGGDFSQVLGAGDEL